MKHVKNVTVAKAQGMGGLVEGEWIATAMVLMMFFGDLLRVLSVKQDDSR